jgi:acylphosphatase
MGIERRTLIYDGQVQGVGFRMTARRLASAFPVSGYVRNERDGRVFLVVEGESSSVVSLLGAIRREFSHEIQDVQEVIETIQSPAFEGFSIRT